MVKGLTFALIPGLRLSITPLVADYPQPPTPPPPTLLMWKWHTITWDNLSRLTPLPFKKTTYDYTYYMIIYVIYINGEKIPSMNGTYKLGINHHTNADLCVHVLNSSITILRWGWCQILSWNATWNVHLKGMPCWFGHVNKICDCVYKYIIYKCACSYHWVGPNDPQHKRNLPNGFVSVEHYTVTIRLYSWRSKGQPLHHYRYSQCNILPVLCPPKRLDHV